MFAMMLKHLFLADRNTYLTYTVIIPCIGIITRIIDLLVKDEKLSRLIAGLGSGLAISMAGLLILVMTIVFIGTQYDAIGVTSNMLWEHIPVSRIKRTATRLVMAYATVIYSYILLFITIIFIIGVRGPIVVNLFTRPLVLIRDFFTAPFVTAPAADTVSLSVLQTEQLLGSFYDTLNTVIFLTPLMVFTWTLFVGIVANLLSCKLGKSTEVTVRIIMMYIFMGFFYLFLPWLDSHFGMNIETLLDVDDLNVIFINPGVNFLYMVKELRIIAGFELTTGVVLFTFYCLISKRHCDII